MVSTGLGLFLLGLNWSTPVPDAWGFRGFAAFYSVTVSSVGLVVALRRPRNPIGWAFLGVGLMFGVQLLLAQYATYSFLTRPDVLLGTAAAAWVANWIWIPGVGVIAVGVFMLFPDGRLPSPRWRWVPWMCGAATVIAAVGVAVSPGPMDNARFMSNPVTIEGLEAALPFRPDTLTGFIFVPAIAAAVSLISRFARAGVLEHQQIKWLASSSVLVAVGLPINLLPLKAGEYLNVFAVGTVPIAAGIAILRYRLYDIDLLIKRTLVYGLLTAALASAYFGSVVLLQALLRTLTGQESNLAVVVSTLGIAALFVPLRRWMQDFIDRRFYRRKYNAARTLAAFGATARDEVDLERLSAALVGAVRDTMQPAHVSLWLRRTDGDGARGQ